MTKPLPPELIAARPALAENPFAQHPSNGLPLGHIPKRYTTAVHDAICTSIRSYQRPVIAAQRAGITAAMFYDWMRRGKSGDPHLWQFALDVETAMADAESTAIDRVVGHVEADPEDMKWWLERTRPEAYSKDVAVRVNAELENFVKRLEQALDPETFEKVLAVFAGQPVTPALVSKNASPEE